MNRWNILYRGPLSSCNYSCSYCPFAKTKNTRQELLYDAECLERFVKWVESRKEPIGILFTPWGEALIHRHYQAALQRLSQQQHVVRLSAQTNLSCGLEWLDSCCRDTVKLWTTYHPTQMSQEDFLAQCRRMDAMGFEYSVGVVGFKHELEAIRELRRKLPPHIYLWINAYKREHDHYTPQDLERFSRIDPHFSWNTRYHKSMGKSCLAGHTSFSVDGKGDVRRCHFIDAVLGNLYDGSFERVLRPRPCTNQTCGCHIGYVYLEELSLRDLYGEGILERIPRV